MIYQENIAAISLSYIGLALSLLALTLGIILKRRPFDPNFLRTLFLSDPDPKAKDKLRSLVRLACIFYLIPAAAVAWIPVGNTHTGFGVFCVLGIASMAYFRMVAIIATLLQTLRTFGQLTFEASPPPVFKHSVIVWMGLLAYWIITAATGFITFNLLDMEYPSIAINRKKENGTLCKENQLPFYEFVIAAPQGLLLTITLVLLVVLIVKAVIILKKTYLVVHAPFTAIGLDKMIKIFIFVFFNWVLILISVSPMNWSSTVCATALNYSGILAGIMLTDNIMALCSRKTRNEGMELTRKSTVRYGTMH